MADNYSKNSASRKGDDAEDEKLLEEARARFKLAEEAEIDLRRDALDDLEFASGKQWHDKDERDREADGRPCLVVNRIPQFIQQVTNDQRQNRPSIKVHPVDDKSDPETAEIFQGLIRHIEYNSSADAAYDTAFDSAVRASFGFWRVVTDYVSPLSFDQEIKIKRIRDRFSVYLDPYSQEADGSDANYAFVFERISKDEFRARYPKAKLTGPGEWETYRALVPSWVQEDGVLIAEYFYKEFKDVDLVLLSNGEAMPKAELDEYSKKLMAEQGPVDLRIVDERKTQVPTVKWCKMNGAEVLEKTDWPGIYIPIVPVYGNEQVINGKRVLESIVRHAKDPQRMLNYWKSAETEAIALAPRAPFVGVEGQFEGYEEEWATANRRNHAYLTYKPTTIGGQPAPPPQRMAFEPAVMAISQASHGAAEDMKATIGIYDASLGGKSNETSGIAIQRRNHQAQTSNFHFIDNLTRSLKHTGRILVDLIPKIYDTARAARIIGEDGEQEIVRINEEFEEGGEARAYWLGRGKYDVTVDVGPSFASKRQEAAASMLELSKANPNVMGVAGDLIVKNMDWPGAQEISERLKKTLPPGMADDGEGQQVPPEIQAQMQQMNQMIEGLTAKLNEAQDDIKTKRVELESRERIEFKKLEVELEIERAKLDARDALALLSAEIEQINARQSLLRMDQPVHGGEPEQDFQDPNAPQDGGMPADFGEGGPIPSGGEMPGQPPLTGELPPGTPMEGSEIP